MAESGPEVQTHAPSTAGWPRASDAPWLLSGLPTALRTGLPAFRDNCRPLPAPCCHPLVSRHHTMMCPVCGFVGIETWAAREWLSLSCSSGENKTSCSTPGAHRKRRPGTRTQSIVPSWEHSCVCRALAEPWHSCA